MKASEASFFSCQGLKILSCCSQYEDFRHLYDCMIFHFRDITSLLMYSSLHVVLCFYIFAIINSAGLNSVQEFLKIVLNTFVYMSMDT